MEHSWIDMHIGSRLNALRNDGKMTVEQVSEGVGISVEKLRRYEEGTERIAADELRKLSGFLNAPTSYFFSGLNTEASSVATTVEANAAAPIGESLELMRVFNKIDDPEARRRLIDIAGSFARTGDAALGDKTG